MYFNENTPPRLFWNRDKLSPPQFQFTIFFEEFTLLGYAFFILSIGKDMESLFPRIFKFQYWGGVTTSYDFSPIRFEWISSITINYKHQQIY